MCKYKYTLSSLTLACEQALDRMEEERKEEGLYAHLKFYCSAPFWHFYNLFQIFGT